MIRTLVILGFGALSALPAQATDLVEMGALEFQERCAVCHGATGEGNGPLSGFLRIDMVDLTTLAARNDDVFPEERVYRVIDGRTEVAAHGPRSMPVWGSEFRAIEQAERSIYERPRLTEDAITERIVALTRYLESIQIE